MTLRPFVLDCDTGRDDALAIWVAASASLPLAAVVSSYGNTPLENVIANNAHVLGFAADHIAGFSVPPLYRGSAAPEKHHTAYESIVLPRQKISGNGLCNVDIPASAPAPVAGRLSAFGRTIIESAEKTGIPLDYLITGPATNLAALLREYGASLRNALGTVTMMGGKFDGLWDTMPGADFNIACDPFAVGGLLGAGLDLRFVPMNATWPLALPLPEIESLRPRNALAAKAQDITIAHCRNFAPEPVFRFHDPAALLACLYADCFRQAAVSLNTAEDSADFGRLCVDRAGVAVAIFDPSPATGSQIVQGILAALGFLND